MINIDSKKNTSIIESKAENTKNSETIFTTNKGNSMPYTYTAMPLTITKPKNIVFPEYSTQKIQEIKNKTNATNPATKEHWGTTSRVLGTSRLVLHKGNNRS